MSGSQRPWYLRAFVAVCAWFTAIFFLAWIFAFFGRSKEGVAVFGLFLLVGGSLVGRTLKDADFLEHVALVCSMAGRVAVAYGFSGTNASMGTTFGLMALAEVVWFILGKNFTYRVISVLSAFLFLGGWLNSVEKGAQIWMPMMIAGCIVPLAFVLLPTWIEELRDDVWQPLGWGSVLVLGLWSLLGGDWYLSGHSELSVLVSSMSLALLLYAFVLWLYRDKPLNALFLLPLLVGLAWAMKANPSVMAGLILGLVGFQRREMKIMACAGATLLAGIVTYYYHLNDTLLYKSGVLAISGILFALGAVWFSEVREAGRSRRRSIEPWTGKVRALAALLVLVAVSGMVDLSAYQAEGLKASGDEVYLQLRPRDPRDPFMGDYMAVNFQVCIDILQARQGRRDLPHAGEAWVRPDELKILRFDSLDDGTTKPGLVRIHFNEADGRISIGTTKIYFQEGDERRYRGARYGRFKLQADGTLTWLGFAGEHLEAL